MSWSDDILLIGKCSSPIFQANLELVRLSIEESLPPPIQRTSILVDRFTMGRKEDLNSINGRANENKMYPNLDEDTPVSEKKINRRLTFEKEDDEDLMDRSIESPELVPLEMDSDLPQAPKVPPSKFYNGFSDVKFTFAHEEMNTKDDRKVEEEDECRSIEGDGLVGLDMDFSDEEGTEDNKEQEFEEVKNKKEIKDEDEDEEDEEEEDVSVLNVTDPEQEESFESLTQEERKMLGRRMLFF